MADKLTKVTQVVLDGSLTGTGEPSENPGTVSSGAAETAARIAGNPQANRVYGTKADRTQGWLTPGAEDFPKVHSAQNADKITGTPGSDKVWGTDQNGIQGWQDSSVGNMNTATYDPTKSGKVKFAEKADSLSGTPLANYVWGTNSAAKQVWLKLDISDIMLKSEFAHAGSSEVEVSSAKFADQIRSGVAAANDTVYSKNAAGEFEWRPVDSLRDPDTMLKTTYDPTGSGTVNSAKEAEALTTQANASNATVYGKDEEGNVGFKPIAEISNSVMLKNVYDPVDSGRVLVADSIFVPEDIVKGSVWTNFGWVSFENLKWHLEQVTAVEPSIEVDPIVPDTEEPSPEPEVTE